MSFQSGAHCAWPRVQAANLQSKRALPARKFCCVWRSIRGANYLSSLAGGPSLERQSARLDTKWAHLHRASTPLIEDSGTEAPRRQRGDVLLVLTTLSSPPISEGGGHFTSSSRRRLDIAGRRTVRTKVRRLVFPFCRPDAKAIRPPALPYGAVARADV